MATIRLSEAEKEQIWDWTREGQSVRMVARRLGRAQASVRGYLALTGGVRPPVRSRAADRLSLAEREEIFAGLVAAETLQSIARRLRRAPSTVSREVARNGGPRHYRPSRADRAAWVQAGRPKRCKLASNARLRRVVAAKLSENWSPQQIAGWLARAIPTTRRCGCPTRPSI